MKYFLTMKLSWSLINKFPVRDPVYNCFYVFVSLACALLDYYLTSLVTFDFDCFFFSFTHSFGRELMAQGKHCCFLILAH